MIWQEVEALPNCTGAACDWILKEDENSISIIRMVLLGHDNFLNRLSGLYSANQTKGTIFVTIKRCMYSYYLILFCWIIENLKFFC